MEPAAPAPPAPPPGVATHDASAFVLRLGRALHAHGYPAPGVEDVMVRAARSQGLDAQVFTIPTAIFVGFGSAEGQRVHLERMEPGEVNLERLQRLEQVASGVLDGRLSPAAGLEHLDRILEGGPRYGALATTLAYAVASAASARMLGGGLRTLGVAALAGAVVGAITLVSLPRPALVRLIVPLAAFVAAALVAGLGHVLPPFSGNTATLAGLIVLLPGLTLTLAMNELSTGHVISGTARLTAALIVFVGLAFGVGLGNQAVTLALGPPVAPGAPSLPGWTLVPAVLLAPLAYTVLLRARPRDTGWIYGASVLAFLVARLSAPGLGPELGVFLGALTAGLASNLYARWLRGSPFVTMVPSILLLVPGTLGFRSLANLLESRVLNGVEAAFRMFLVATALVAGLLIANLVLPPRRRG
jgi:uncharacterized membrane protein YjjP (DUF1212 family)